MTVASTVAGLGSANDGDEGIIEVSTGHREHLRWHASLGAWVGEPHTHIRQVDGFAMRDNGNPAVWRYPHATSGVGSIDNSFGFALHDIRDAGLLSAAGLTLQENNQAAMRGGSDGLVPRLAINWYDLGPGDAFLSPVPSNFGIELTGVAGNQRFVMATTGWQNAPIDPFTKNGYPECYVTGSDVVDFARLVCRHRWVSTPLSGSAGEPSVAPPFAASVLWHLEAAWVPRAHNEVVDTWPDYSGRGSHMKIRAGAPVLKSGSSPAYVSFDGVTDCMETVLQPGAAQPYTMFMVLRQRAEGGTQQMWFDGSGLLYRDNATNKVNLWLGGGPDLTYNRASNWPSDFICVSVVANGASSNIWEDRTLKVSGDCGTRSFTNLLLANNTFSSLPAAIDVRTMLTYTGALNDTDRNTVLTYLGFP